MFSRLQWLLLNLSRQMWLRAAAFSALGIVSALMAVLLKRYIPADLPTKIGADAVSSLLNIIASSMLAVTIFSLSTMVTVFSAAAGNVTPRATRLLAADSTTQNALATFIGSFLFSLVGIICLNTGIYGNRGRVILYAVTLVVLMLIVVTLLRWVDYVLKFGRVAPISQRVEEAATAADVEIIVAVLPGDLTGSSRPLAYTRSGDANAVAEQVRHAFGVEDKRSFDQDPRFGLCVLSEIASRAMSTALNDPGTAIDILGRGARVLARWAPPYSDDVEIDDEIHFPRVHVPPLDLDSMFDDLFVPIARDGAANIEVTIQLQKMLQTLASLGEPRYRQGALKQFELATIFTRRNAAGPSI